MSSENMNLRYLLLVSLCILYGTESHELRYALFTAGFIRGFDSPETVTAVELAEEMINTDSSILPGYSFTHGGTMHDARMCDRTVALNGYFDAVSPWQPTILGLIGCGCPEVSEVIGEIIHHHSISQISCSSIQSQHFSNSFSVYPFNPHLPAAKIALLQKYNWKRAVFIIQEDTLFAETYQMEAYSYMQIEARSRTGSTSELKNDLQDPTVDFFFEKEDFRVFFLNTDSNTARQIICEAHMRGLTYPRYAWVTNGWYQSNWWTEEVAQEQIDCSDDELENVLHRALILENFPEWDDSNALSKISSIYGTLLEGQKSSEQISRISYFSPSFVASLAYDALWTLALALNSTAEMVQSLTREEILSITQCEGSDERTGRVFEIVPLENFTYTNQLMGCIVRWNLERTDFVGVLGRINFDETGLRVHTAPVRVSQYMLSDNNNFTKTAVAYIKRVNDTQSIFHYNKNRSNQTMYPRGVPPDGTPVTVVVTFHLALVVIYYVLASAGLVFSTVCLIFNFTQRKRKVVRLNSPNLNYIIILGSCVINTSIFLRLMFSTDLTINIARCNLNTLLITIGYCLAYGALLAKMGRIYYIFNNPTPNRKLLKDWHLVLIALLITAVGTSLSVIQVAVPILRPVPYYAPNEEPSSAPPNELGLKIEEVVVFCYSSNNRPLSSAWIVVTTVYLALLQLIGVILALRIHKTVKFKGLRDSKYIISAIYVTTAVLVIFTVSTFALGNLPNVIELLVSGSLMVATTAGLSLVFIPKMVSVYKDPKGERVMEWRQNSSNTLASGMPRTAVSAVHTDTQNRLTELESQDADHEKPQKEKEMRLSETSSILYSSKCSSHQNTPIDIIITEYS